MVERILFGPGGSTEAKQDAILTSLSNLLAELTQKYEGGPVALDAATLAALEQISVTVTNWPASQTVAGTVALDAGTLAALETINAVCSGEVALDAATLAALETITATVANWPDEYPLPAAQVTALTPQTDALTDAELRASPVPVTGFITSSVTGEVEIKNDSGSPVPVTGTVSVNEPVTVDGAVALDSATLSALETVTAVGPLTDTELRASPVPVTGTVSVQEPVTVDGTINVGNFPAATEISNDVGNPIPVMGTVAVTGTQTDALTDAELRAAQVDVADSGEREYTHVVATVTASGDTIIHTPAAGKAVRLRWMYAINQPTATSGPLISIRLGATEVYRVWALSKRQRVTGPVDGPLVVNLDTSGYVAVSALLEEV